MQRHQHPEQQPCQIIQRPPGQMHDPGGSRLEILQERNDLGSVIGAEVERLLRARAEHEVRVLRPDLDDHVLLLEPVVQEAVLVLLSERMMMNFSLLPTIM